GPTLGERATRPVPPRPAPPRPGTRSAPAANAPAAARPGRPRRFRVTPQNDEAQFERTMRQFLSGPDASDEGVDPPA
ncbi:MAG TPA: hypothetical protein VMH24_04200, partial [Candidatus Sulfotelmatobacter sp.]|nr:hypothetical protein [Candidatus Sulfotelmatobacter sp.]